MDQNCQNLCVFDISLGETRYSYRTKQLEVTRQELNGFQELVETLRSASPTSAQNTLDHLRASGDSAAFTQLFVNDKALYSKPLPTPSHTGLEPSSITNIPHQALVHQNGIRGAVDAFFLNTGKLFQVFTRDEIDLLFYRVSNNSDEALSVTDGSAIAKLYSVASVGSSYMQKPLDKDTERSMHEKAKLHLDDVIETAPLEAAKVCSLLAQRLVLGKHKAAMAYVRIGLNISQSAGMHIPNKPPHLSHPEWVDGRKVWRTLVFFACWLSATVGFGDQWVLEEPCITDVDLLGDKPIEERVQTEMVKIAALKFAILRMKITFQDSQPQYGVSIKMMTNDLDKWYAHLPSEIQLVNVAHAGVSTEVRRTVYFMHLSYLGCLMLLSRRLMSTFPAGGRPGRTRMTPFPSSEIESFNKHAVIAAEQSARILDLLLIEDGVFQDCWVCIFQSFVSAALILHDVAKQFMILGSPERVVEQLAHAAQCLEVLKFCRENDQAADIFYASLLPFYERLQELTKHTAIMTAWDHTIAARLCVLVRVPFGEHDSAEVLTSKSWRQSGDINDRYDHSDIVEHMDRQFEASYPFTDEVCSANSVGPEIEMT